MLVWLSYTIDPDIGLYLGIGIAAAMNTFIYFNSSKLVLNMARAKPLKEFGHAWIYETTQELAHKMNLPMPSLWIINKPQANAFATGRNPKHGAIALSAGLINNLSEPELRGVIAHELSHIKHRDILIGTIATILASIIGYISNRLKYEHNPRETNPFSRFIITMIMPIAALLIRFGISRSREFSADQRAAYITREPMELAAALEKIHELNKKSPFKLFNWHWAYLGSMSIAYPTFGQKVGALLSTHPPVSERVKRLEQIEKKIQKKS